MYAYLILGFGIGVLAGRTLAELAERKRPQR